MADVTDAKDLEVAQPASKASLLGNKKVLLIVAAVVVAVAVAGIAAGVTVSQVSIGGGDPSAAGADAHQRRCTRRQLEISLQRVYARPQESGRAHNACCKDDICRCSVLIYRLAPHARVAVAESRAALRVSRKEALPALLYRQQDCSLNPLPLAAAAQQL